MKIPRTIFAGAAALIGAVALIGFEAGAQPPIDLPPLPDAPEIAVDPAAEPVVEAPPLQADGGCTPGRCTHRLAFSRRRCKRRLQEAFLGFPEEFERPPLGAMVYAANGAAVGNAEAAAMILRPFDFRSGTARLNLRGGDKIRDIQRRLPVCFAPVIIERTRDPALDESRRAAVLTALAEGLFPIPPERVLIGPSISRGVSGEEGLLMHGTELQRVELTGPRIGQGVAPSLPAVAR